MKNIKVKNIVIGKGLPKIAVSIVERYREEIIKRARGIDTNKTDLIEWRADFYVDVLSIDKVLDTLSELRSILVEIPIIFTFRSKAEGGEMDISMDYYTSLNKAVAESSYVDLIDVEVLSDKIPVKENIRNIHKANIYVIGSNHNFKNTPSKNDMVDKLRRMDKLDCDILKLAVMPNSSEDVIELLSASNNMKKLTTKPLLTISMGSLGIVSRISGQLFGSDITFGVDGNISADGQIDVGELFNLLRLLALDE